MEDLTFLNDIPQDFINTMNDKACYLRNKLGNEKGIIKFLDNSFMNMVNRINEKPNKYGVGVIFTVLEPEFYPTTAIANFDKNMEEYNNSVIPTDTGRIHYYNGDKPVFKFSDESLKNQILGANVTHWIENKHKINLSEQISEYYSYLESKDTYIRTSDNFNRKPIKVWICLSAARGYLNYMSYNQNLNESLHSAHIWTTTYISSDNMNMRNVNILDTNSVYEFNYTYLVFQQHILQTRFNKNVDFLVNVNVDSPITQFYELNTQLQNKEVWGLCQTFALTFYIILIQSPQLCFRQIENILLFQTYYDKFIKINGLIKSGGELLAFS